MELNFTLIVKFAKRGMLKWIIDKRTYALANDELTAFANNLCFLNP